MYRHLAIIQPRELTNVTQLRSLVELYIIDNNFQSFIH